MVISEWGFTNVNTQSISGDTNFILKSILTNGDSPIKKYKHSDGPTNLYSVLPKS